MKKLLAVLCALTLLLPAFALAEGVTLSTSYAYGFDLLTQEAYPMMALTADNPSYRAAASTLTAAPKDGLFPYAFSYNQATYIDAEANLSYSYYLETDASYEVFLKDATDKTTVADGSNGYAAYVDLTSNYAYGLIGADAYEKTAKLYIVISGNGRYRTIAELSALISAECERILPTMAVAESGAFWSEGVFAAAVLSDYKYPISATVDVTNLTVVSYSGGYSPELTLLSKTDADPIEMNIDFTTNSYVAYQKDSEPENVFSVTMDNGRVYNLYTHKYDDEITGVYADTVVREADEADDDARLLELQFSNVSFKTQDEVAAYVESIDALITLQNDIDW